MNFLISILVGWLIGRLIARLIIFFIERERKKRIDLIFQTFQDSVEEAYKKDPDMFKKMFAGAKPLKSIPKDIFIRRGY